MALVYLATGKVNFEFKKGVDSVLWSSCRGGEQPKVRLGDLRGLFQPKQFSG